jgi:hypothetical protein
VLGYLSGLVKSVVICCVCRKGAQGTADACVNQKIIIADSEERNYMSNKYNIKTVEIQYNGNKEQFDKFLENVLREYISEDKISPDTQTEKSA